MKVIYEDFVDWEPLQLRFVLASGTARKQRQALAEFVLKWMERREHEHPMRWRGCEYSAVVALDGSVEALCELMPSEDVQPLADAVGQEFPFAVELRLGEVMHGSPTLDGIDWFEVPGDRVEVDGKSFDVSAFTISLTAVTVGQFSQFMTATGYEPLPDIRECPGYTIDNLKLNWGHSPKLPLFGLTYDDAQAFCEWGGFRLPTDPELCLFFETAFVRQGRNVDWGGQTWTSTPAGENMFFVRDGPYRESPSQMQNDYRKALRRDHYELTETPVFRIVRA